MSSEDSVIPVVLSASAALVLLYTMSRGYVHTTQMPVIEPPKARMRLQDMRARDDDHQERPRARGRMRAAAPERPLALAIEAPLEYDRDEGAYMLRVGLGRGLVSCVVDSGSAHLTVKGSDCSWSNCYDTEREARRQVVHVEGGSMQKDRDGRFCIERTCPCGRDANGRWLSDCRDRSYTPSSSARKLRGGGALSSTLAYGSQTNSVQHYEESLSVMDTSGAAHTLPERMVIYQIYKVDGDTSSNILGLTIELQQDSSADRARRSFLEAANARRWSCVLDERNPTLVLHTRVNSVPEHALHLPLIDIARESALSGLAKSNVLFYTCRLVAIGVRASSSSAIRWWRAADGGAFPHYVVFDTGTTNSYADARLGPELRQRLNWSERAGEEFHLKFENGQSLSWSFDDMLDPDGVPGVTPRDQKVSALHCERGRTYDDFSGIFMGSYFIMVGIRMMKRRHWLHDLDSMLLHVWDV